VTFEIAVDGRSRTVAVERRGEDWQLVIDGRPLLVSAAAVAGRWSILIGEGNRDGPDHGNDGTPVAAHRSYEVTLDPDDGRQMVCVDGRPVRIDVVDGRARRRRGRGEPEAGADGPRAITAPMPGRIVKVLVERGQTVAARQGVIVVEAMKMENELRAPRAGTVTDVKVAEGMTVEAHAVLVVLE
jgi:biotin carboxyl carrier protein